MFNNSEDFYSQRDDRTNRCIEVDGYQKVKCLVVADAATASSYSGQVMILTSINILSRWCRNIDIMVPDNFLHSRLLLPPYNTLHGRIKAEIEDADPFGSFNVIANTKGKYDCILQIGNSGSNDIKFDVLIDGDGWLAIVGQKALMFDLDYRSLNPVGPAMAACIGVAQIFKSAIGYPKETLIKNLFLSAFDYADRKDISSNIDPSLLNAVDIGKGQLIGVGSVGSAFLYFLRMLPVKGNVTLIDHDIVKTINLNRSPIFGISNIGKSKVTVGCQYLYGSGITAIPFCGSYSDYIKTHGRKRNEIDLLFPLANEDNVRWAIENNFPPLMIYGTTTKDWGINLGRHIPYVEDCLVCRYPESKKDIGYVCSEGNLSGVNEETSVDAALPFLSPLSSVLMVGEVIKTQFEGYPFNENFLNIDLKGDLTVIPKYTKKPKRNCSCNSKDKTIFNSFNGQTKYSFLSK